MLTIFSVPKPFEGEYATIQYNAIKSWSRLDASCRLLLLGNEAGTADMAAEVGAWHVGDIARDEDGVPLLSGLFDAAERCATSKLLAYVNADIILLSDFPAAVRAVSHLHRFVMTGLRVDIDVAARMPVDAPGWEGALRERVRTDGRPYSGLDYFVFPRRLWTAIPPFAIGRFDWDNWLPYAARLHKALVVDATEAVLAVHQRHGYPPGILESRSRLSNKALAGEGCRGFSSFEATHILTNGRLETRCRSCYPMCVCSALLAEPEELS